MPRTQKSSEREPGVENAPSLLVSNKNPFNTVAVLSPQFKLRMDPVKSSANPAPPFTLPTMVRESSAKSKNVGVKACWTAWRMFNRLHLYGDVGLLGSGRQEPIGWSV